MIDEKDEMLDGIESALAEFEAAPNGETTLRVGQLLAISLEGNASTGYSWEIDADGAPQLTLAPPPDDTGAGAAEGSPPKVGSPTTLHWHFEAAQPGTTTVRLVYLRPWEKEVAPAQTAEFKVTVTAATPSN